tara:strand:+ start:8708 stop:9154 length:447 start_codon:yes stop_codon:yes gene_type:complete
MTTIDILKTVSVHITFNKNEEILKIKLLDNTEYSEIGFQESLEYLKNTFIYIKENNLKCSFICDLRCNSGSELPLHAYVKLVSLITDINSILISNCHCIIIITHDSEKLKGTYSFITKLWRPTDQRPLEFMNNEDNISDFILMNKLHN